MNNAIFVFDNPPNEPILTYLKGSKEREELEKELKRQASIMLDIPLIIGGKEIRTGNIAKVVMPNDHQHVLAEYHQAGPEEARMAIEAALNAKECWMNLSWIDRSSIFLKAADLILQEIPLCDQCRHHAGAGKKCIPGRN